MGLFDIIKATLVLIIIWLIFQVTYHNPYYELLLIAASLMIVVGHIKSVWIWLERREWHGGKGAAPLGGIILFLSWQSFIVLYVILMGSIQVGKRFINRDWIYNNFIANAIMFICLPFVIYWFTSNLLQLMLILVIEMIIIIEEREKVIEIITKISPR